MCILREEVRDPEKRKCNLEICEELATRESSEEHEVKVRRGRVQVARTVETIKLTEHYKEYFGESNRGN